MTGKQALTAFIIVMVTIILLALIEAWTGVSKGDAIMTGLIGLAGGFVMGRNSAGAP